MDLEHHATGHHTGALRGAINGAIGSDISGLDSYSGHDVVVVGGRCAGAATAMLLARQGLDVVVVDRAEFPSDTLSTHAIARGGVVQLNRWGLLDELLDGGAPPIRTVLFRFPGGEIVREIKDFAGVDHLLAPRRYVLDDVLQRAAADAGAEIRTGVNVTGVLTNEEGRVNGIAVRDREGHARNVRARFVVGADGVRSRIARAVDAKVIESHGPSGMGHYAYVAGLEDRGFEFHLGERIFAGVFPTHGGEANVWVLTPAGAGRSDGHPVSVFGPKPDGFLDELEAASPSLAARVRSATITSPVRGAVGLPNHVLEAAGPGWALVGDAGYHRDPITGHGITDAFRDAELLAARLGDALLGRRPEDAALAAYANVRNLALAPTFEVSWKLSQFPPLAEFIRLQKELSNHLEAEAAFLAGLPSFARPYKSAAA